MLERVECSDSAEHAGMCCRPPLALSSMRADLAVDEFKAASCVCNLLAKASSELGEKIGVLASGSFGIEVQLRDFASKQRGSLGIELCDIALGVLDLARNAEKLRGSAFASDGGVDLMVIVKQTL